MYNVFFPPQNIHREPLVDSEYISFPLCLSLYATFSYNLSTRSTFSAFNTLTYGLLIHRRRKRSLRDEVWYTLRHKGCLETNSEKGNERSLVTVKTI